MQSYDECRRKKTILLKNPGCRNKHRTRELVTLYNVDPPFLVMDSLSSSIVYFATMVLSRAIAAASLASIAAASPLQLQARLNSTACAQVASSVAAQSAPTPSVDANLAYDCITSVPLHKDAALHLLEGVVPYFKWQSNTAWLKDPPAEYVEKVQPAVDVWGGLENIKSKVESEEYANEFEVTTRSYNIKFRVRVRPFRASTYS